VLKITEPVVHFAWLMNDATNTYTPASLPIDKIMIKVDNTIEVPTIKFRWRPTGQGDSTRIQDLMDRHVIYAVITIREHDWPKFVQVIPGR